MIDVKRGVITAISEPMNTHCTANGKFIMRSMETGLGFPALIGQDGSFDHKASFGADTFSYRGQLGRNGSASGYSACGSRSSTSAPRAGTAPSSACRPTRTAKRE